MRGMIMQMNTIMKPLNQNKMTAVEFLEYVLCVIWFILTPIGLIGVGYVAVCAFLDEFKSE